MNKIYVPQEWRSRRLYNRTGLELNIRETLVMYGFADFVGARTAIDYLEADKKEVTTFSARDTSHTSLTALRVVFDYTAEVYEIYGVFKDVEPFDGRFEWMEYIDDLPFEVVAGRKFREGDIPAFHNVVQYDEQVWIDPEPITVGRVLDHMLTGAVYTALDENHQKWFYRYDFAEGEIERKAEGDRSWQGGVKLDSDFFDLKFKWYESNPITVK